MTNLFKNIKDILIAVLLIVVVLVFVFRPKPVDPDYSDYIKIGGKEYIKLSEQVDTTYITKTTTEIEYVPVPGKTVYKDKIVEVEVPADVDTTEILKDYFAERTYNDTIPIDSIGNAYIIDVISKNRIKVRKVSFDYQLPTITNTTYLLEPPKRQVFFGGGVGFDKINIINNVKTGFLYKAKDDKILGLHVGVTNSELYTSPTNEQNVVVFIEGSMYWPIKFGRK